MGAMTSLLSTTPERRVLMVGLDAAGKTTILYKLKLGEPDIPAVGLGVETVQYKDLSFTTWDLGGQDRIRHLWRHYYQDTRGIIFVVDCNDQEQIGEAAEELHKMLLEDGLRDAALLIFANKQDLPNALSIAEVTNQLNLCNICRDWHVQPTCAISGDGLYEGLDWLTTTLDKKKH